MSAIRRGLSPRRWLRRYRASQRLERMRNRCDWCGRVHSHDPFQLEWYVCSMQRSRAAEQELRLARQRAEDAKPGPKRLYQSDPVKP